MITDDDTLILYTFYFGQIYSSESEDTMSFGDKSDLIFDIPLIKKQSEN